MEAMAARYHLAPSELLKMDAEELSLNVLIYKRGFEQRSRVFRDIIRTKPKSDGDVLVKILNVMLENAS